MTIQDNLRIVSDRWLTVAITVVILILSAGATWFARPREFTASLTLYVSAQPAYTTQDVLQSTQLSPPLPWSTRMTSYVELLTSPRVSEAVIERLRLSATPEDLSKQITASSATDSVLIDVAVTDRSAAQAAEIANAVGIAFSNLVDELERPRSPEAVPPVAVRTVRTAAVPTEPSSLGLPVMLTLGLLSGAAIGVGVALTRNAFATSAKAQYPMSRTPAMATASPGASPGRDRARARTRASTPRVATRSTPLDRAPNSKVRRLRRSAQT